ncbi:hypothetical protein [Nonomuraea sp. NPDC049684]|uniref:hypothetical protein n=1 Tax=Nonomuraea sp. NPDC049684 TaxID=3364356 RepID=UPI0037877DAF
MACISYGDGPYANTRWKGVVISRGDDSRKSSDAGNYKYYARVGVHLSTRPLPRCRGDLAVMDERQAQQRALRLNHTRT